jgi:hypothetical protein
VDLHAITVLSQSVSMFGGRKPTSTTFASPRRS